MKQIEKIASVLGWVFVLIGFSYSVVVGNGSELPKMVVTILFLSVGSTLCLIRPTPKSIWVSFALVSVITVYFFSRAYFSPVWDLARRDVFLVAGGFLAFGAALSVLRSSKGRASFLVILAILIWGNGIVGGYQYFVDPEFRILRTLPFSDFETKRVATGFFYHRNSLACFLQLCLPVFVAHFFLSSNRILKANAALCVASCIGIGFLTFSRWGFSAMLIGGVLATWMSLRVNSAKVRTVGSTAKQKLFILLGVGGALVFAVLASILISNILGERGGEVSVEGSLRARLSMYGIALNVWQQNVLFGAGSQTFSYLFPRYFYGLPRWSGDAQMAHSEYFQLLSDYGIIGFLLVLLLIVFFGFLFIRKSEQIVEEGKRGNSKTSRFDDSVLWLLPAAFGALGGVVTRAMLDFQLYLAPNLILLSLIIGGGVVACSRVPQGETNEPIQRNGRGKEVIGLVVCLLFVLLVAIFGLKSGWRELTALPKWIQLERDRVAGLENIEEWREYAEQAPSFHVLRPIARQSLKRAITTRHDVTAFEQAKEDWKRLLVLHPFEGEVLANYARCLDELGELKEAEDYHLKALEAVGRRENKYGVLSGVGGHFLKLAEQAFVQRKTERSLFLYLKAEEAFVESQRRGYNPDGVTRKTRQWVRERIEFLEGARIVPEEGPCLDWQAVLPRFPL